MDHFEPASTPRKSYSNVPRKTLSFVDVEDVEEQSIPTTYFDKNKSKTEKSVHFADEESVAEDESSLNDSQASQTSRDVITWLPSEHLYSADTFIHDTEIENDQTKEQHSHDPATSIPTVVSYGSNTFEELDSGEEDTDTEQLYSYTDSFISSEVFSSQSRTTTYKEWKDVTEIVKDIEDLEESEFVTRADSFELGHQEGEDTEASETFDDEIAEEARQSFIAFALRHLRLKEVQSPRSLAVDSVTSTAGSRPRIPGPRRSKEEKDFRRKMIERCKQKSDKSKAPMSDKTPLHPFYAEMHERKEAKPLEYYGLNSSLVERLKLENLQHSLSKKSQDLDRDVLESKRLVDLGNEALSRETFLSEMCGHVRRENMEDTIQAHLIKMHPVEKLAEFLKDLPKAGEDVREILYQYKRQLERRMEHVEAHVT